MSANTIIFDAQYISEQVKNLESAEKILEEAMSSLKNASAHNGWRCPEVARISSNIDEIKTKLGNLNNGVEGTARALKNGSQRFQELESRSEQQVNNLSNNLRDKYGFSASKYGRNGKTNLPVTEIPSKPEAKVDVGKEVVRVMAMAVSSVIGSVVGALVGMLHGLSVGLVNDLVEEATSVFKSLKKIGSSIKNIFTTPMPHPKEIISIAANTLSIGAKIAGLSKIADKAAKAAEKAGKTTEKFGKFAQTAEKIGNSEEDLKKFSDISGLIDSGKSLKDSADVQETREAVKDICDILAPASLDSTILKGTGGTFNGMVLGQSISNKITATILNKILGESSIPGLNPENIEIKTGEQVMAESTEALGMQEVHDVFGHLMFSGL